MSNRAGAVSPPMTDAHQAIYDRLAAHFQALDAGHALKGLQVYAEVPEGTALPYIVVGDQVWEQDMTKGLVFWVGTVLVEAWSQGRGTVEVHSILKEVVQGITKEDLSIGAGWSTMWQGFGSIGVERQGGQGRQIRFGSANVRLKVQWVA